MGKVYVQSGDFEVPKGVSQVKVFAIGGGAGGGSGGQGGGGSGYWKCEVLSVNEKQVIQIRLGKGGAPGHNGENTLFGNLLLAEGGYTANGTNGGNGGSGGGAGSPLGLKNAGNGGSQGRDGKDVETSKGGIGQKDWFKQWQCNNFTINRFSNGYYGTGASRDPACAATGGGGGGGGARINGANFQAGFGKMSICGGQGGVGFGAGGGAGGTLVNMTDADGGQGADGLVYIEYGDEFLIQ